MNDARRLNVDVDVDVDVESKWLCHLHETLSKHQRIFDPRSAHRRVDVNDLSLPFADSQTTLHVNFNGPGGGHGSIAQCEAQAQRRVTLGLDVPKIGHPERVAETHEHLHA